MREQIDRLAAGRGRDQSVPKRIEGRFERGKVARVIVNQKNAGRDPGHPRGVVVARSLGPNRLIPAIGIAYAPASALIHGFGEDRPSVSEARADEHDQLAFVDRLRQIVRRAGLNASFAVLREGLGRDGYYRQLETIKFGTDPFDGLEPIHFRHHYIHQHYSKARMLLDQVERLASVFGLQHFHLIPLQQYPHRVEVARIVIHDQRLAICDGARILRRAVFALQAQGGRRYRTLIIGLQPGTGG